MVTMHCQRMVSIFQQWCTFFYFKRSRYCIFNRLLSSIDVTFIHTGKPNNSWGLLYCDIRFTAIVCSRLHAVVKRLCFLPTHSSSTTTYWPRRHHSVEASLARFTNNLLLLKFSGFFFPTSFRWNNNLFVRVCGSPISLTSSFQFILLNPIPPPLLIILESARVLSL